MSELTVVRHVFEGADLVSVLWEGRPCWVAKHIGRLLCYGRDGSRLAEMVSADPEYIRGRDYALLTGDDLSAYKAEFGKSTGPVDLKTNVGALVLFESGVHLALAKTRKPIGVRLRRFLADEVLPQLVRTGRYEAPDAVTPTAHLADLERRVGGLEAAVIGIAQGVASLTQTVAGIGQGVQALITHAQTQALANRHIDDNTPGVVTAHLPGARVQLIEPTPPDGFDVHGLSALADAHGCSHQRLRKRLENVELWTDADWHWTGQRPVLRGNRLAVETAHYFKSGIAAELARREAPLFA